MSNFEFSTGHGAHGDYLFGWEGDALQRGMDALGNGVGSEDATKVLKIQSGKDAIACTKAQQAKEDIGTDTCKYSSALLQHATNTCFRAQRDPRKRPGYLLLISIVGPVDGVWAFNLS